MMRGDAGGSCGPPAPKYRQTLPKDFNENLGSGRVQSVESTRNDGMSNINPVSSMQDFNCNASVSSISSMNRSVAQAPPVSWQSAAATWQDTGELGRKRTYVDSEGARHDASNMSSPFLGNVLANQSMQHNVSVKNGGFINQVGHNVSMSNVSMQRENNVSVQRGADSLPVNVPIYTGPSSARGNGDIAMGSASISIGNGISTTNNMIQRSPGLLTSAATRTNAAITSRQVRTSLPGNGGQLSGRMQSNQHNISMNTSISSVSSINVGRPNVIAHQGTRPAINARIVTKNPPNPQTESARNTSMMNGSAMNHQANTFSMPSTSMPTRTPMDRTRCSSFSGAATKNMTTTAGTPMSTSTSSLQNSASRMRPPDSGAANRSGLRPTNGNIKTIQQNTGDAQPICQQQRTFGTSPDMGNDVSNVSLSRKHSVSNVARENMDDESFSLVNSGLKKHKPYRALNDRAVRQGVRQLTSKTMQENSPSSSVDFHRNISDNNMKRMQTTSQSRGDRGMGDQDERGRHDGQQQIQNRNGQHCQNSTHVGNQHDSDNGQAQREPLQMQQNRSRQFGNNIRLDHSLNDSLDGPAGFGNGPSLPDLVDDVLPDRRKESPDSHVDIIDCAETDQIMGESPPISKRMHTGRVKTMMSPNSPDLPGSSVDNRAITAAINPNCSAHGDLEREIENHMADDIGGHPANSRVFDTSLLTNMSILSMIPQEEPMSEHNSTAQLFLHAAVTPPHIPGLNKPPPGQQPPSSSGYFEGPIRSEVSNSNSSMPPCSTMRSILRPDFSIDQFRRDVKKNQARNGYPESTGLLSQNSQNPSQGGFSQGDVFSEVQICMDSALLKGVSQETPLGNNSCNSSAVSDMVLIGSVEQNRSDVKSDGNFKAEGRARSDHSKLDGLKSNGNSLKNCNRVLVSSSLFDESQIVPDPAVAQRYDPKSEFRAEFLRDSQDFPLQTDDSYRSNQNSMVQDGNFPGSSNRCDTNMGIANNNGQNVPNGFRDALLHRAPVCNEGEPLCSNFDVMSADVSVNRSLNDSGNFADIRSYTSASKENLNTSKENLNMSLNDSFAHVPSEIPQMKHRKPNSRVKVNPQRQKHYGRKKIIRRVCDSILEDVDDDDEDDESPQNRVDENMGRIGDENINELQNQNMRRRNVENAKCDGLMNEMDRMHETNKNNTPGTPPKSRTAQQQPKSRIETPKKNGFTNRLERIETPKNRRTPIGRVRTPIGRVRTPVGRNTTVAMGRPLVGTPVNNRKTYPNLKLVNGNDSFNSLLISKNASYPNMAQRQFQRMEQNESGYSKILPQNVSENQHIHASPAFGMKDTGNRKTLGNSNRPRMSDIEGLRTAECMENFGGSNSHEDERNGHGGEKSSERVMNGSYSFQKGDNSFRQGDNSFQNEGIFQDEMPSFQSNSFLDDVRPQDSASMQQNVSIQNISVYSISPLVANLAKARSSSNLLPNGRQAPHSSNLVKAPSVQHDSGGSRRLHASINTNDDEDEYQASSGWEELEAPPEDQRRHRDGSIPHLFNATPHLSSPEMLASPNIDDERNGMNGGFSSKNMDRNASKVSFTMNEYSGMNRKEDFSRNEISRHEVSRNEFVSANELTSINEFNSVNEFSVNEHQKKEGFQTAMDPSMLRSTNKKNSISGQSFATPNIPGNQSSPDLISSADIASTGGSMNNRKKSLVFSSEKKKPLIRRHTTDRAHCNNINERCHDVYAKSQNHSGGYSHRDLSPTDSARNGWSRDDFSSKQDRSEQKQMSGPTRRLNSRKSLGNNSCERRENPFVMGLNENAQKRVRNNVANELNKENLKPHNGITENTSNGYGTAKSNMANKDLLRNTSSKELLRNTSSTHLPLGNSSTNNLGNILNSRPPIAPGVVPRSGMKHNEDLPTFSRSAGPPKPLRRCLSSRSGPYEESPVNAMQNLNNVRHFGSADRVSRQFRSVDRVMLPRETLRDARATVPAATRPYSRGNIPDYGTDSKNTVEPRKNPSQSHGKGQPKTYSPKSDRPEQAVLDQPRLGLSRSDQRSDHPRLEPPCSDRIVRAENFRSVHRSLSYEPNASPNDLVSGSPLQSSVGPSISMREPQSLGVTSSSGVTPKPSPCVSEVSQITRASLHISNADDRGKMQNNGNPRATLNADNHGNSSVRNGNLRTQSSSRINQANSSGSLRQSNDAELNSGLNSGLSRKGSPLPTSSRGFPNSAMQSAKSTLDSARASSARPLQAQSENSKQHLARTADSNLASRKRSLETRRNSDSKVKKGSFHSGSVGGSIVSGSFHSGSLGSASLQSGNQESEGHLMGSQGRHLMSSQGSQQTDLNSALLTQARTQCSQDTILSQATLFTQVETQFGQQTQLSQQTDFNMMSQGHPEADDQLLGLTGSPNETGVSNLTRRIPLDFNTEDLPPSVHISVLPPRQLEETEVDDHFPNRSNIKTKYFNPLNQSLLSIASSAFKPRKKLKTNDPANPSGSGPRLSSLVSDFGSKLISNYQFAREDDAEFRLREQERQLEEECRECDNEEKQHIIDSSYFTYDSACSSDEDNEVDYLQQSPLRDKHGNRVDKHDERDSRGPTTSNHQSSGPTSSGPNSGGPKERKKSQEMKELLEQLLTDRIDEVSQDISQLDLGENSMLAMQVGVTECGPSQKDNKNSKNGPNSNDPTAKNSDLNSNNGSNNLNELQIVERRRKKKEMYHNKLNQKNELLVQKDRTIERKNTHIKTLMGEIWRLRDELGKSDSSSRKPSVGPHSGSRGAPDSGKRTSDPSRKGSARKAPPNLPNNLPSSGRKDSGEGSGGRAPSSGRKPLARSSCEYVCVGDAA